MPGWEANTSRLGGSRGPTRATWERGFRREVLGKKNKIGRGALGEGNGERKRERERERCERREMGDEGLGGEGWGWIERERERDRD